MKMVNLLFFQSKAWCRPIDIRPRCLYLFLFHLYQHRYIANLLVSILLQISAFAKEWAEEHIRQGWTLKHRDNLKSCTESGALNSDATGAVQAFYDEKKNVDFDNPEWGKKKGKVVVNGHFLTMIDKTMGRMGVGCAPNPKVSNPIACSCPLYSHC